MPISLFATGGSGTQLQYRAGSSSLGGVAGSSWDGTTLTLPLTVARKLSWTDGAGTVMGTLWSDATLNTFAGYEAGLNNDWDEALNEGWANTYYGHQAGRNGTTCKYNAAFGTHSLTGNTIGNYNAAFGPNTLIINTGSKNAAFGANSLQSNVNGGENAAYGVDSLYSNVAGSNNAAFGVNALRLNLSDYNSAFGYNSLPSVSTGSLNIGFGMGAGVGLTTGSGNMYFGVNTAPSASNATGEFIAGSDLSPISNIYFGKGFKHATPAAITFHGTGGNGTNIVGGNLVIAPGISTGSGTPAKVILQGTAAIGSGTTAQTLTDVLTITNNALITLADAVDVAVNATTGTKWGTATGQKQGWWGATPVVQQILATGAGATVDNVISLLQTLGLCKQS